MDFFIYSEVCKNTSSSIKFNTIIKDSVEYIADKINVKYWNSNYSTL